MTGSGKVSSPDTQPGETAMVNINFGKALQNADIFQFTAVDHQGKELYTWSWPVIQPEEKAIELISTNSNNSEIDVIENGNLVTATVNQLKYTFIKENGRIKTIENSNGIISFSGGPVPVGVESEVTGTKWELYENGNFGFEITYSSYPGIVNWTVTKDGLLGLEAGALKGGLKEIDYVGISFYYPEEKCKSVSWMGRGPYRVWKNRTKGSNIDVWEKVYNNTITGESFNELIYPEFKGYHGNLYWVKLETTESPFTIISATPNLYFQLFTPAKPNDLRRGDIAPSFPDGDISFLYHIPAIGTKFKKVGKLGPQSQKGVFKDHNGDQGYPIKLWFDFKVKDQI